MDSIGRCFFDSIYPRVPLRECQQPTAFLWRLVSWRCCKTISLLRLAPVDLYQSPACLCQTPPAIRRGERRFGHSTNRISRQMARFRVAFFGASTRSARTQARPPVAARRRSNSWEASGSIVVRSLIDLKTQPGGPYVLWDDHPSDKGLARVQRVEPVFNGAPLDAGRFQFLRLRPIMPVMPGGKNAPCKGSGLVSGPKLRLGLHGSGARRSSWTARPAGHPHRQPRSEFMTQRCRGGKRAVR